MWGYLGFVEIVVDAAEHGQDEGRGFACAGLGLTDHVGGSAGGCGVKEEEKGERNLRV
jgi:hypothetical protein